MTVASNDAKLVGELLTLEEVAREMRVSVWSARLWVRQGKLAAMRPNGGRWLVARADLEAFKVRPPPKKARPLALAARGVAVTPPPPRNGEEADVSKRD